MDAGRGGGSSFLDPDLTPSEATNVSAVCRADVCVGPDGLISQGDQTPRIIAGDSRDGAALILFTSGTSGTPKGVVLSHRAVSARIALNIAEIGPDSLSRVLQTLPMHFGHGLIGVSLTTLFAGGTLLLRPRGLAMSQGLGQIIDGDGITFMSSVPTLWRIALRMSKPPLRGTLQMPRRLRDSPCFWRTSVQHSRTSFVNGFNTNLPTKSMAIPSTKRQAEPDQTFARVIRTAVKSAQLTFGI